MKNPACPVCRVQGQSEGVHLTSAELDIAGVQFTHSPELSRFMCKFEDMPDVCAAIAGGMDEAKHDMSFSWQL